MCAKLSDLKSYAEKMNVTAPTVVQTDKQITLTQEEREFLIAQIDEEMGRNKSVLQRKCSKNIKPKTREKFERQWRLLNELKEKLK